MRRGRGMPARPTAGRRPKPARPRRVPDPRPRGGWQRLPRRRSSAAARVSSRVLSHPGGRRRPRPASGRRRGLWRRSRPRRRRRPPRLPPAWRRVPLPTAGRPTDATLQQALARACAGLWDSYGQSARALIQRQEFPGARRVIREALAEDGFPEERREAFGDLLAATFSGEIGQLTAHAIRVMQDEHEREALASLERAEALLASVPTETLTPKRREEVNRRLWWGYTKLGARRVASGAYEDAVEPLFHALRLGDANPEQQDEARATP